MSSRRRRVLCRGTIHRARFSQPRVFCSGTIQRAFFAPPTAAHKDRRTNRCNAATHTAATYTEDCAIREKNWAGRLQGLGAYYLLRVNRTVQNVAHFLDKRARRKRLLQKRQTSLQHAALLQHVVRITRHIKDARSRMAPGNPAS
jgi:hypothetical protein